MVRLLKLPLIFFLMAAAMALMLRWHLYQPIDGLAYPFLLHAHSHVMFLGWVLNVLLIAFVYYHVPVAYQKQYQYLLILLSILVLGMALSFSLQGYGLYSIVLSGLHTVGVMICYYWFVQHTSSARQGLSVQLAKQAFFFFLLASLGPMALSIIKANGLGHTPLYSLAIYFYLHFQYNGVFTFGLFSLLLSHIEREGITFNSSALKTGIRLMLIACVPAYALSTLWTFQHPLVVAIALLAAILQIVAAYYLGSALPKDRTIFSTLMPATRWLITIAAIAFVLKLLLQLLSVIPQVATLAYETRPYIIAYLHLVLLGFITAALLSWYAVMWKKRISPFFVVLFVSGFILSELTLVGTGHIEATQLSLYTLLSTLVLLTGAAGIVVSLLLSKPALPKS